MFHNIVTKTLLVIDCVIPIVLAKKPNILHPNGLSGDVTAKRLWKRTIIGYLVGWLVHEDQMINHHSEHKISIARYKSEKEYVSDVDKQISRDGE